MKDIHTLLLQLLEFDPSKPSQFTFLTQGTRRKFKLNNTLFMTVIIIVFVFLSRLKIPTLLELIIVFLVNYITVTIILKIFEGMSDKVKEVGVKRMLIYFTALFFLIVVYSFIFR